MYPVESVGSLLRLRRLARGARVGRTVVLLGLTSLFTDISSEMVVTVLPLYLIYSIGLSPVQFGFIDGLNNGAAAVARLIGGSLGDRRGRHKDVAATGYGLSALTRPLFLIAGGSVPAIGGIVLADRIGKGIRTAPRDALISLRAPAERLGLAFGFHRALDTCGAMIGPLAAFSILAFWPNDFHAIFVLSFAAGLIGLAIIVLLVDGGRKEPSGTQPTLREVAALTRVPQFRTLMIATSVLSVATISDAFAYLELQRRIGFDLRYLPLLYVGTALAFMLLAVPIGQVADRVGRSRVFVAGYGLLIAAYLLLLIAHSVLLVVAFLVLFGTYYAATDGVLAAAGSAVLPERTRGTGLAGLATCTSLGRFAGSIGFGALWVAFGAQQAVAWFAAALVGAVALAAFVVRA
jgi:MFS family permease